MAESQWEISSKRIDLVIIGDHARLAVECDGSPHHLTTQQIHDDAERERELRRAGWTFWRLRSSAFALDPEEALTPLWDTLTAMGIRPLTSVAADSDGDETAPAWTPVGLSDDELEDDQDDTPSTSTGWMLTRLATAVRTHEMKPLDDSTLEEIAVMVCGDDAGMKYRRGWEIPQFLRRAGVDDIPDHDGSPRRRWVLDFLRERQEDQAGDVEAVILRLANRREYQQASDEYTSVMGHLQKVLALEGLRIDYLKGEPVLAAHDADEAPRLQRVALKVAITDVVSDPDLARTVQLRLDEARICQEHGAYTAAVIMLGSLLEGVLVHAAEVRTATTRLPKPLRDTGPSPVKVGTRLLITRRG